MPQRGLVAPGDTVPTECLTYPHLHAVAAMLGLRMRGVAMDAEGLLPDALEDGCRDGAALLYTVPVMQNPTASIMPVARRQAVVAVARRHGLTIIEDDAQALLLSDAPRSFAQLVPELCWHVATLAKCLTAAPLQAELAGVLLRGGGAAAVLAEIAADSAARQAVASRHLPPQACTAPAGLHGWLPAPRWHARRRHMASWCGPTRHSAWRGPGNESLQCAALGRGSAPCLEPWLWLPPLTHPSTGRD